MAEMAAPDTLADQPRCGLDNHREVAVLNVVYLCSVYNRQGNASPAYGNTEAGGPTALSILTQSHGFRRFRDVLGCRCADRLARSSSIALARCWLVSGLYQVR